MHPCLRHAPRKQYVLIKATKDSRLPYCKVIKFPKLRESTNELIRQKNNEMD